VAPFTAEQSREEAWCFPDLKKKDHIFLILEVKESLTSQVESSLVFKRRVMSSLPIGLFGRTHLGFNMCPHTWKDPEKSQIQTQSQVNQNDYKGNLKEMPLYN
jgi:hypothetical protein